MITGFTLIIARPGDLGSFIDAIRPETGRTMINGHTLEQVQERYPDAYITTYEAWAKAKAAQQDSPIIWSPTTAEKYSEMLDVLPPAMMLPGGFLVGEPCDHHAMNGRPRFQAYRQIGDRYLVASRPMTRQEFRSELGCANG